MIVKTMQTKVVVTPDCEGHEDSEGDNVQGDGGGSNDNCKFT